MVAYYISHTYYDSRQHTRTQDDIAELTTLKVVRKLGARHHMSMRNTYGMTKHHTFRCGGAESTRAACLTAACGILWCRQSDGYADASKPARSDARGALAAAPEAGAGVETAWPI